MTAKYFYSKHFRDGFKIEDSFSKSVKQFNYYDLTDFAEAYADHKLKVYEAMHSLKKVIHKVDNVKLQELIEFLEETREVDYREF